MTDQVAGELAMQQHVFLCHFVTLGTHTLKPQVQTVGIHTLIFYAVLDLYWW